MYIPSVYGLAVKFLAVLQGLVFSVDILNESLAVGSFSGLISTSVLLVAVIWFSKRWAAQLQVYRRSQNEIEARRRLEQVLRKLKYDIDNRFTFTTGGLDRRGGLHTASSFMSFSMLSCQSMARQSIY